MVAAVVVAAGRGLRAGGGVPKQYRAMPGGTALDIALRRSAEHREITLVQPVIHPDDRLASSGPPPSFRLLPPVFGGATRQASVRAGLEALAAKARDRADSRRGAAVCFARPDHPRDCRGGARRRGGAGDAGRGHRQDGGRNGLITGTLDRARCVPCRLRKPLVSAIARGAPARRSRRREDFTDDAALAEWAGMRSRHSRARPAT